MAEQAEDFVKIVGWADKQYQIFLLYPTWSFNLRCQQVLAEFRPVVQTSTLPRQSYFRTNTGPNGPMGHTNTFVAKRPTPIMLKSLGMRAIYLKRKELVKQALTLN